MLCISSIFGLNSKLHINLTVFRVGVLSRAGNWWKITARNRTTVHYGEPLQTVVNNCNPQFTRRTK